MRVLVTGATGFVGRWLMRELESGAHEAIGTGGRAELDITDAPAVEAMVSSVRPDAIAHLAGISYGPDARRDTDVAFAVNAGGTRAVMAAATARSIPVLVVSSSEVYGSPTPDELPLRETAPLVAEQPYGLSKLAQERVAHESTGGGGPPLVIVRPFNHTGPGQRREFVVPALAERVVAARRSGSGMIAAGNVDVRRDFSDVRDVVRAYRLILEDFATSAPAPGPRIYNVASGRTVAIRDIAESFAALAGIDIRIDVDPSLVRESDPPEIRGDASSIEAQLGWRPTIPFERTLRDVYEDVAAYPGPPAR